MDTHGVPRPAPVAKTVADRHYEGSVNSKYEFHGYGTLTVADGERYDGEFVGGKKHGHGTLILPGGARYVGEFCNDKRHGHGTQTLPDGQRYVGEFLGDKRQGQGTQIWPNGYCYKGELKDDQMHGYGVMILDKYDTHAGEFRNGLPNGHGKRTYKSGRSVLTQWLDSKKFEGETHYNLGDGMYYTGQTKESLPHGRGVLTHGNDAKYAGEWVYGKCGAHVIRLHRDQWSYYLAERYPKKRAAGYASDGEESKKTKMEWGSIRYP